MQSTRHSRSYRLTMTLLALAVPASVLDAVMPSAIRRFFDEAQCRCLALAKGAAPPSCADGENRASTPGEAGDAQSVLKHHAWSINHVFGPSHR
jgi:hypothetical protein